MKIIVLVLTTLLIISSLFFSSGGVLSEELFLHKVVQQSSEIKPSYDLFAQASKSLISVNAGENKTATIILDYDEGLTFTTVGLSTIIKPQAETANKIDSNLLNLTDLLAKDYILNNQTDIIVSFSDDSTIGGMADHSAKQGIFDEIERTYVSSQAYNNMHFFAARMNYSAIFEVAESTNVNHVWLDRKFKACLNQSVRIIKDPVTWATIESSFDRSINGTGVRIAVIDTGIDPTHPDFYFPNGTSKIVGAASFTGEPTADGYGHGTHCASIAAGTGAASEGQYVGVAPGGTLLNAKVLDNVRGEGQESWIISGIQWSVDNNANVLSMSFGTDVGGDGTDPLSTTVNWAVDRGVVCAVAAGNAGSEMYTIASPGAAERAITVGASSKSDVVASFSSRGPTSDQRTKPDVVAPGVDIVAARATGTSLGTPISQYYTRLSGTSMATPHVAGAAALLLDAHPSWDPARVKRSLTNYANDTGSNVFEQGSGRIDVCKTANASIIGNCSLSFGRVSLNSAYKQVLDFQNLAAQTLSVSLNVQVWHIADKTPYQVASLNTSILTLAYHDDKKAELSLNTIGTLLYGYFEGRITAIFGGETIHVPFFFLITPQLNVKVIDETGSTVSAAFVLIDANTHSTKGYLEERQQAQFVMPPGNYIVQAMNIYLLNPSGGMDKRSSFIVHQSFSAGTDETINLQLSLTSARRLELRSTDTDGNPISIIQKLLLTPYYTMQYLADMGVLANQYIYVTNLSEYMSAPCYFGYAGLSQNDLNWAQANILTSDVDAYFIGWDLSKVGAPFPNGLNFDNSELATFTIETTLPGYSSASSIWFNQIAGMWQTLLWRGFQTHPGITWRAHVLPYQYKTNPSSSWANNEWSCVYVMSTRPDQAPEYYVIDRHFQPITKGENLSYTVGKTPLLPQDVYDSPPYYESPPIGLCIPYYPLRIEKNLFLAKTDAQATKRLEVFKNGNLISNQTMKWAQDPVQISQFLQGYGLYSFIVKTATSLNWSSQNAAEYMINYTSASLDLIPPSITKIDCNTCFTSNQHQVQIQLADNYKVSNVSILYSADDGPYMPSQLTDLGNYTYSATLTFSPSTQKISLAIEAYDGNGNKIKYTTNPAATRGYETRIDAQENNNRITGKLTIIGGLLVQPVYLKVRSSGTTMYIQPDASGNFAFDVLPPLSYPLTVEMKNMATYGGSIYVINQLQIHDVAIIQLVSPKSIVSGYDDLAVTTANQGNSPETFKVTVYANTTSIASQNVTLTSGTRTTITITWNAISFAKGNYSLSAYASPVPNETNMADNNLTGGWVLVVMVGDVTGPNGLPDGRCDVRDVSLVASLYGVSYSNPKYNPTCDIVYDGKIDVRDLSLVAANYGRKEY
jgi:serine protease AprX